MAYWVLVFLLSKQKTAYEMRISDWSSDVCSSDLILGHRLDAARDAGAARAPELPDLRRPLPQRSGDHGGDRQRLRRPRRAGPGRSRQIGRASCRERGCTHVSISVVADAFKKTNVAKKSQTYIPQPKQQLTI